MSRALADSVTIFGQIERVTYTNPENGFTIARVRVRGRREPVTVVGRFMEPTPGEVMDMTGTWKIHPTYGEQFEVDSYSIRAPSTINGIKKYLGSGLVRGIGPVMAERIVDCFGKSSLDVIENNPDRLRQVEGIGEKRIEMIRQAWAEQKEIRNVMLFLQSHEVSAAYAVRIFRRYGQDAVEVVTENPYRLATDISGIGFLTADKIAGKLGFEKNHPLRIRAGVLYVLNQLADEGHVYYPYEFLIEKGIEILETGKDRVAEAIEDASSDRELVIEEIGSGIQGCESGRAVYLTRFYVCETGIAKHFARLCEAPKSVRAINTERALQWVEQQLDFSLADNQKAAVRCAAQNKVMVITGGPGTGKTTIIRAVLEIFKQLHVRTLLAAPTGRAAKKMTEATGHSAGTIHRLLSFNAQEGGFQKNQDNPLKCDMLIVDEASMIDTVLMYNLLKAVPPAATLVLVGDVHQLPSVGPGNVLNDVIASEAVPVVRLSEIFRQARQSRIIVNAHQINSGIIPELQAREEETDFYFIEQQEPEKVVDIIVELVSKRIPRRFFFDPVDDVQVLSPMHKGVCGTANLNRLLQERLNPGKTQISAGGSVFRLQDKVMQIRNNYEKQVFNGDIGRVAAVEDEFRQVKIGFDGREIDYSFTELDEVLPAYAVSVHKSQGSEFPVVVMPVLTQHYIMLQRNLLYTAVTRGRRLVVLVGTKKALAIAVKNDKPGRRYTHLASRIAATRKPLQ
ncbi:MAG: ATP-dependent RecD-like DNA helicase [Desulfobacteraceae bacterium]|nr:ATP-dependent RecD-like DNA helicase [Desulfobacteraceae bacterium]MCF8095182.1 ATP-dependent RecD-like DNA helicase [Desulfobacteraceae bacterium]